MANAEVYEAVTCTIAALSNALSFVIPLIPELPYRIYFSYLVSSRISTNSASYGTLASTKSPSRPPSKHVARIVSSPVPARPIELPDITIVSSHSTLAHSLHYNMPSSTTPSAGLTPAQLSTWHDNGYLIIPDAFDAQTVSALLAETHRMLDEDLDIENHPMTRFSTGEGDKEHVGDDYFLRSGDKIRFFFEEG